jgi:hypothetical protein
MATIRKRLGKWQVQIRRKNYPNIIKTFSEKSSADRNTKTGFKKGAIQKICRVKKLINNFISKISLISLRFSYIYTLKK